MDRYFEPWLSMEPIAEYYCPIEALPKQQGSGRSQFNRTYQGAIADGIACAGQQKAARRSRIGLKIVFLGKFHGDQANCLKAVEDGMNRRAYHDDGAIDFHMIVRVPSDKPAILIQVLEVPES